MSITILNRNNFPMISNIEVDDEIHYIGEVQPFNGNIDFINFLQGSSSTGMSFVKLSRGERHELHCHDVPSLVIITRGKATLLGKPDTLVKENDVICIDAGSYHGFDCNQGEDMECISVQFENEGLFDNTPNINFDKGINSAKQLIDFNEKCCDELKDSAFFNLFSQGLMVDSENLNIFSRYLRQWSSIFQHIMFSRQVTSINANYFGIFLEHLKDEFGHDELLPESQCWDGQVDAYGNWFVLKMFQWDNLEKLVVVHLVLEKCGDVFHAMAKENITKTKDYIDTHAILDHNHSVLGKELYDGLSKDKYSELEAVCCQSWEIMGLLLDRISQLTMAEINQKAAAAA